MIVRSPQTAVYPSPLVFVPSTPPPTAAEAFLRLAVFAGVCWLCAKALLAIFQEPRDTCKYIYVHKRRVPHGITNDLDRREAEHRRRWPGGYIQQVGRRTTRSAALAWERIYGF